jgi:hypothetical protein
VFDAVGSLVIGDGVASCSLFQWELVYESHQFKLRWVLMTYTCTGSRVSEATDGFLIARSQKEKMSTLRIMNINMRQTLRPLLRRRYS